MLTRVYRHIHKRSYMREELLKLQPRLAESNINVKAEFPIVSIVQGMTFVLVELESEEALKLVATTGSPLSVSGLDEDWNKTFVGTYFFVRSNDRSDGTRVLRTRMIEGTLEDPATGSAASDLAGYISIVEGKPNESLRYEIIQGVEMGRRSEIFIEVVMKEDTGIADVYLEGSAVQVMAGRLMV
jgi:PhzF family phenazine biosynthesis protein